MNELGISHILARIIFDFMTHPTPQSSMPIFIYIVSINFFVLLDVSQIHTLWNATFVAPSLTQQHVNIILFYMLKELD